MCSLVWLQEHWGIEPLLKIDLEFADGHVVCHPSLEETSQIISAQLDAMAHQLKEVQDDCLGAVKNSLTAPPSRRMAGSLIPSSNVASAMLSVALDSVHCHRVFLLAYSKAAASDMQRLASTAADMQYSVTGCSKLYQHSLICDWCWMKATN